MGSRNHAPPFTGYGVFPLPWVISLIGCFALVVASGCTDGSSGKPKTPPGGTDTGTPSGPGGGSDAGHIPDATTPDPTDSQVTLPDGGPIDPPDVYVPEELPPKVVNVFSPDGQGVLINFSEIMDPVTASVHGSYRIRETEDLSQQIGIIGAQVRDNYVTLSLDPNAQINGEVSYTMTVTGPVTCARGHTVDPAHNRGTIRRPLYLNIVWHQHQPSYYDPIEKQFMGPWVRHHSKKSYYDMAAIVEEYPGVHFTVNLTPVLLYQIEQYLELLDPCVDADNDRIIEDKIGECLGKTDPWVDLLLTPTPTASSVTPEQLLALWQGPWSCVSASDAVMNFWPEYKIIRDKQRTQYTQDDFMHLKIFFELAWFDPDFLEAPGVTMPNGWTVDLSDVVEKRSDGKYYLRQPPTEELAKRLVVENYKILANVIPIHKHLMYNPDTKTGQIEVTTTPYYHPILPLIHDTESARQAMPYGSPLSDLPYPAFQQPDDAHAHVAKAAAYHKRLFGIYPRGMWPAEGSVSESTIEAYVNNKYLDYSLQWIATDQGVMERSGGGRHGDHVYPFMVDADGYQPPPGKTNQLGMVFRDTYLSDRIGFDYKTYYPNDAVREFIQSALAAAPRFGAPDRLLTIILDGENAWEGFVHDYDAKQFFHLLYQQLQELGETGELISVTPTEYIDGNPNRNIPAHPIANMRKLDPLWAGSWIPGPWPADTRSFSTWIGEMEELAGWEYLREARADLGRSGLPRPNPIVEAPPYGRDSLESMIYMTWQEMYAAEGSDWFWWFGDDQNSPTGDEPFCRAFRAHLSAMYDYMNQALTLQGRPTIEEPSFPPIIQPAGTRLRGPFSDPPTIDGNFNAAAWDTVGGSFRDDDSGAMAGDNPNDQIARIYYGYTESPEDLYLAVEFNNNLNHHLGTPYYFAIYTSHKHITNLETGQSQEDPANATTRAGSSPIFAGKGLAREIKIDFSGNSGVTMTLSKADGNGNWIPVSNPAIVLGGPRTGGPAHALEFKIPFSALDLALGDPIEVFLETVSSNTPIDIAPNYGSYVLFEDETNMVYVTFEVDVTGSQIPIDLLTNPIVNPPPPAGVGTISISGNHPRMCQGFCRDSEPGDWCPNHPDCNMFDDGDRGGDQTAGDNKWTLTLPFAPGTQVRYKYSSGTPSQEGHWYQSEEFPVSYRGFMVDQTCKRMHVRDVFADRPPGGQDGIPGSLTDIQMLECD